MESKKKVFVNAMAKILKLGECRCLSRFADQEAGLISKKRRKFTGYTRRSISTPGFGVQAPLFTSGNHL
jgi:hypothetical protein